MIKNLKHVLNNRLKSNFERFIHLKLTKGKVC